jgi:hypothetical protein
MKQPPVRPTHGANRRKYARLVGPYPGEWSPEHGTVHKARVGQLSLSGCFVSSAQTPNRGERVIVTVDVADHPTVPIAGTVVNARWSDGFGVKFEPMSPEHADALKALLDELLARHTLY